MIFRSREFSVVTNDFEVIRTFNSNLAHRSARDRNVLSIIALDS